MKLIILTIMTYMLVIWGFMILLRILLPFLVLFVASCPNAAELKTSKDVIACIINDGADDHKDDGHHVGNKNKY